jgi:DNA-binding transcriptional regulator/RsmH inhibitor MraZ
MAGTSPAAGDWVDEFCDSIQTKLDERGRIKLPTEIREFLERKYGTGYNEFYITSLDGESAEIYPLCEWKQRWRKILDLPQSLPLRTTMVRRYTRFGKQSSMDPQGRMPIREELRDEAVLTGEVTVTWEGNLLRVISMNKLRETPPPTPQQLDEAKAYKL